MTGLRIVLLITFAVGIIEAVVMFVAPEKLSESQLGPQDIAFAHYGAATMLGLAAAAWYAYRNPIKNVAVVRALLAIYGLWAAIALYHGIVGLERWGLALWTVIPAGLLAIALAVFYPRGQKAT